MKSRLLNLLIAFVVLIASQLTSSVYAQGKVAANAGIDQTVCAGDTVSLSAVATGGTQPYTYTWMSSGGTGGFLQGQTVKVVLQTSTTYTLTARDAQWNSGTDAVVITVNPKPAASAGIDAPMCYGASAVLTATGGGTYLWNTDENTNMITPSPQVTTTYTVTVTSPVGCTASDAAVVIVNKLTTRLTLDHTICMGGSSSLVAGGGNQYAWSTGGKTNTILVTPTATTTYTCTFTGQGNGCTESLAVVVTVSDVLISDAGVDQTICTGATASLRAAGGNTFIWSSGATTQSTSVTPTITTTYSLTATDGVCTATDFVVISLDKPVANADVDTLICAGSSINLTATGGVSYVWSTQPPTATQILTVKPTVKTTYTVTATSIHGCTASDAVIVSVNASPTANAGGAKQVCLGSSISLTATGGGTYAWSNGDQTTITTISPNTTSTYTVTVANINGCTASNAAVVTVRALPTVNAGVDASICLGANVTLSAAGGSGSLGSSFLWSSGAKMQTIVVNPTLTTTYTVTLTNLQTTCTASDDIIISVNTVPTANAGLDATICSGNSVDIAATGDGSYNWSTKDTTAAIVVTPAISTTYTVTVTGTGGCTNSDAIIVTVNVLPTVNAGKDVSLCLGSLTNLIATASNGSSVKWSTGAMNLAISVAPTTTTTYTITATTQNFCTATDELVVTVNAVPTADAGADAEVCAGLSVGLTASGGNTYRWNNNANTASITVTPTTKSTYTVTATSIDGCTSTDVVIVSVNTIPVANAGTDDNITQGGSVQFNASATGGTPTYNYSWTPVATLDDASINNPTASPTVSTLYMLTVTDSKGCADTDQKYVIVQGIPGIDAGADATICAGASTQLSAVGFGGTPQFTYSWTPATSLDAADIANPVATPAVTTTYTIVLTDGNGKTAIDQVVVSVNTVQANAGQDVAICAGTSTSLTASGGVLYNWSTGTKQAITTIAPKNTTTYTVTVTDANTCTATDNVIVTVNAAPTANAGLPATICSGDSVLLDASGGIVYYWNTGATTAMIYVKPIQTTPYTVTVTDNNGCTNSNSVTVTVNQTPTVNAGKDVAACIGSSVILTATATNGTSVRWNNGSMQPSISVAPTVVTTYTVTASTTSFCTASDEVVVSVTTVPIANAGADVEICLGSSATLSANTADTYAWSTQGSTKQSVTVVPTGTRTYTVTITVNGCSASDAVVVNVNPLPTANAGSNQTICSGGSVNLLATGGATYEWSTLEQTAAISVIPAVTTTYSVSVTDAKGCTAKSTVVVIVNAIPTVNAGKDDFICKYTPLQLSASTNAVNGAIYLWTSIGKLNNSAILNPSVSTSDTSLQVDKDIVFKLQVTDAKGCSATDSLVVTFMASCNLKVGGSASSPAICIGGASYLTAWAHNGTTPYTFVWDHSLPVGAGPIKVTPTSTTDYTVIVIDGTGARDTAVVTVNVNQLPTVTAGADASVCIGSSIDLLASGSGIVSYVWNTNATTSFINVSPAVQTTYTVTGTDYNTCTNTAHVVVLINALPTVSLGKDSIVCAGNSIMLNPGTFKTYSWSIDNNIVSTSSTINIDSNGIGINTAVVKVDISDNNNCKANDIVNVTFNICTTTANNDITTIDVDIYPNPSTGLFNLNFTGITSASEVLVMSLDGQLVSKFNVKADSMHALDLTAVAKGVYFVKVMNDKVSLVQKIVVQ